MAFAAVNPSYTTLMVMRKPSWVRPPSSYNPGSVSSLVVAFEDPDGTKLKGLLAERHLYAFGNRIKAQKWKQLSKHQKEKSSQVAATHSQCGDKASKSNVNILPNKPVLTTPPQLMQQSSGFLNFDSTPPDNPDSTFIFSEVIPTDIGTANAITGN